MQKDNKISVNSINELSEYGIKSVSIAIGVFDGVHVGHQLLLTELLSISKKSNSVPVVLTFYPNPKNLLNSDTKVRQLTSLNQKINYLSQFGVKKIIVIPFTQNFSRLSPAEFINNILLSPEVDLKGLCVGLNWKFGYKGTGDTSFLAKYANKHNFIFKAVKEKILDNNVISSTIIRKMITSGNLSDASKMLGKNYILRSEIITGLHIATDQLNYPTANLALSGIVVPPAGVYAGYAKVVGKNKWHQAAIIIGNSPTFKQYSELKKKIEVHLLEFKGDIYGEELDVEFIKYIREERYFSNADKLIEQIKMDLKQIKDSLIASNEQRQI